MITIKNAYKRFGSLRVLKGVNLKIEKGETVVILGASGCGKSVLLKLMVGLLIPDSGDIFVDGKDISMLSRKELYFMRTRFGMLFQSAALFDSMNVYENVSLGLTEHTNMTEAEKRQKVEEKLALVGLTGIEKKQPSQLSGGMRKRVGLARAICMDPEILLYDEPTTGLDPTTADTINDLIIELNNKLTVTSIAVTHDLYSAFKIGDRFAMLNNGVIICDGNKEELQGSDDPYIRDFLSHH
jgi:phospholipid/cholesterol/gamma-HCH transport system ATP-binding protein